MDHFSTDGTGTIQKALNPPMDVFAIEEVEISQMQHQTSISIDVFQQSGETRP